MQLINYNISYITDITDTITNYKTQVKDGNEHYKLLIPSFLIREIRVESKIDTLLYKEIA